MECPIYTDSIDYSNVNGNMLFDIYQRVLDIVLSVIGLLIGIPLMVIFGILIKVEDNGPITYKQERLGKGGKKFYITEEFNQEIPGFINRLAVKPGLTGWAQVNGGYEITPEEKLREDIFYIKNRSILLDLKILFKTVKVVLTGDGAR